MKLLEGLPFPTISRQIIYHERNNPRNKHNLGVCFWSSRFHVIYRRCRRPDGSTCVRSHVYNADNTQFYDSCRPSDFDSLRARLSHCASDTDLWCRSRRLQLNANKTKAIWFGSKSNLSKLSTANTSVQVGFATIKPSAVVRDLGLHLDSELSIKHHVAKVAAVCFYHLRRLREIRRRVGTEATG